MTDLIKIDSRYLHGEDLRKGDLPCEFSLTIKSVDEKDSARSETKQVIKGYPVTFKETEKILVLNGTNTKLAVAALETNSRSEWLGKKLTLFPAVLAECFGQTNVLCIRVRVPNGQPKPFIMPKHLGKDLIMPKHLGKDLTKRDKQDGPPAPNEKQIREIKTDWKKWQLDTIRRPASSPVDEWKSAWNDFAPSLRTMAELEDAWERLADAKAKPSDTGEITADEEWELFARVVGSELAMANDITAINVAVEKLNIQYMSDAHARIIFDMSELRREEIRDGRGESSH